MPWHPPCALSNLIVTNLSSCQSFHFESTFSPETNCKIVRISALVRSFEHIRNWFLYKMFFPSGCAVFKVHSVHAFAIPENDTGSRRRTVIRPLCFFASWTFSPLRLFALSSSSQLSLRSTWNESPSFLFDSLPRKEVIQPHLPIRLPCYDFTPVIGLTFDGWLLSVTSPASGAPNSHGVTGGVYKARERIHRGMLIRDY